MRQCVYAHDKMANHEGDGSIAQELWQAIQPLTYRGIVPHIGKKTAVKLKDFDEHYLNENYWLDTRNCKHGRKVNRQQIFELFSAYSGEAATDVREGMLVKIRLDRDFYRRAGHVIFGTSNIDAWMKRMSNLTVPADELAIFVLSHLYNRHTMIYTSVRPWTTLALNDSTSIEEAHSRCQTHLVYLGQNMYGVLQPRPFVNVDAPLTMDEVLNPMWPRKRDAPEQDEPLNLSALPQEDTDSLVSNPTVHSTAASNTETSFDSPEAVALPTLSDPEVPEVSADTTVNLIEPSDQESNTRPPTPTAPSRTSLALCHAVEDACNKLFQVDLVPLTNAELERYLIMKPDNIIKTDNKNIVTSDSETPPKQSDKNPASRCAPVNYAESSVSDGGSIHGDTTDSDQQPEPEKPKWRTAVSRHGPSLPRMATQRLIKKSRLTVNQKKNTDSDQRSSSGSSRSHSPETTKYSKNRPTPSNQKRQGELSIQTFGIKKAKKDRTFSCKECDYKGTSIKLLNEHHVEQHNPVPCTECDHISATPSFHDQHLYKHKEQKFPCDDCEYSFVFKSELTAHRYSHRTDRSFKCMSANCGKTFKCDSELQKHIKKHGNVWWYCDCYTYKNRDIRNLQKHVVKHTKKLPHICVKCGKGFRWYQQLKRHIGKKEC